MGRRYGSEWADDKNFVPTVKPLPNLITEETTPAATERTGATMRMARCDAQKISSTTPNEIGSGAIHPKAHWSRKHYPLTKATPRSNGTSITILAAI